MGDGDVGLLIKLDVSDLCVRHTEAPLFLRAVKHLLRQAIGIGLLPVATRARRAGHATQAPAICVIPAGLHVPRRAPRIRIDGLDAVRVHGLLRYPQLLVVGAVPVVDQVLPGDPGLLVAIDTMWSELISGEDPIPLRKMLRPAPFVWLKSRSRA